MEYGILVVSSGEFNELYQIIGAVSSPEEARGLAEEYSKAAIADADDEKCELVSPDTFEIHRRGPGGWYTVTELLDL
jgi:hypothetical protein